MSRPIEVTMQAIVGTQPTLHTGGVGREFITFRLASTPSIRHADGSWHDGETMWVTAKAWGPFAENIGRSLRKGQPVLATGRLSLEKWVRDDGEVVVTYVLSLHSIGHDLTRGRSDFLKVIHSGHGAPSALSPNDPSADAAAGSTSPESDMSAADGGVTPVAGGPAGLAGPAMTESGITDTPAGENAPGNAQWELVDDEVELNESEELEDLRPAA